MIKNLLTTCLIITSVFGFSQDEVKIGHFYTFVKNIDVIEFKESDVSLLNETAVTEEAYLNRYKLESARKPPQPMKKGWMFKVIKTSGQFYIFRVINQAGFEGRIFGMTKNEILNYAQIYRGNMPNRSFVTSAVTIPIKIRPGDGESGDDKKRYFDFEGNVNIGLTAGLRDRISKNGRSYLNYIGGISIGSTKITPETVSTELNSETNASILTPFVGVIYEYNDFQIGAFLGWDHIGGKIGKSWIYQGKGWLGVGLGYSIFTTKDENPED